MTISTEQQMQLNELQAILLSLKNDLNAIPFSEPTLLITKDSEIDAKKLEIENYNPHDISRVEYINTVQPLKTELRDLIEQNESIKTQNQTLIEQAQTDYSTQREPILTQITGVEAQIATLSATIASQ